MPKIVGDYKILKTLGEGSFSKVKKVINIKTDKLYAMKIINLSDVKDKVNESQIKRRIETMSKISHPGMVKLRAIMHSKNRLYLVFDLAEGELFNTLAQSVPLTENVARKYFQQLIDILSFLQKNEAQHRDLKSENLLVNSKDDLFITDFIFSNMTKKSDFKDEEEENEEEDQKEIKPLKTPLRYYAAPEVLHNEGYVSSSADVWSAGVILYTMLTGDLPFDGSNAAELEEKIKKCNVYYPKKFPEKAKNLLKRIFVVDPERRLNLNEVQKDPWFKEDYHKINGKDRHKKIPDTEVTVHYTADTKGRTKANKDDPVDVFELIARLSGVSIDGLVNDSVPIKSMTSFTSNKSVPDLIKESNKMLQSFAAKVKESKSPKIIKALIPICSKEVYLRIEFSKISDELSLVEINRMKGGQMEFLRVYKLIKSTLA